jgi:hypothetical protein
MPTTKEFTIHMEDRPGTLGKLCRALADRNVNIVAFQAVPIEGTSLVHLVVDNPTTAKTVLDSERLSYKETDVARVALPHRAGELARAAERLGEAKININFAFSGLDPAKNEPVLFFGVADATRAANILDHGAAAAAGR